MEENTTEQETDSFLDQEIDVPMIGSYVKREEYADSEHIIQITDINKSQFDGQLDCAVELAGEPKVLTIRPTNQHQLKQIFGNRPRDWLNKDVKLTFGPHITEGDYPGVKLTFSRA